MCFMRNDDVIIALWVRCSIPDSNIGWLNVAATSVLSSRRWSTLSQLTLLSVMIRGTNSISILKKRDKKDTAVIIVTENVRHYSNGQRSTRNLTRWVRNKMATIYRMVIFKSISMNAFHRILIEILLKLVPNVPIDNKSSVAQLRRQALTEQMMSEFIVA